MSKIAQTSNLLILFFTPFFSLLKVSLAIDAINTTQSISDGQTLISAGESFELGFFRPGASRNRYLGMWYKKVSQPTYVWVANREHPLTDSSGVFRIDDQGSLVILNGTGSVIWSSNQTKAENPVLQLLESGNLVLREEGNTEIFLWQSFDYPSDTLLPGMKLGLDFRTGINRFLTSWRNNDDPSPGEYTFKIDPRGVPQAFVMHRSSPWHRGGPWNGLQFSGCPEMDVNFIFNFDFTSNPEEVYYSYEITNNSIISRLVLNQTGEIQRLTWSITSGGTEYWNQFWHAPNDQCDDYNNCGPFGVCNTDGSQVCTCLDGFEPRSPDDWYLRVFTGGCVRKKQLDCQTDEFSRLERMKLPEASNVFVDKNMILRECEDKCLKDCSCTAYSNDRINGGSGCIIWVTDLVDLRQFTDGDNGQDLFVRMAHSELGRSKKSNQVAIIVSVTTVSTVLLFGCIFYCLCRVKRKRKNTAKGIGNTEKSQEKPIWDMISSPSWTTDKPSEYRKQEFELPVIDLATVAAATDNLSMANKLGAGGFGPVYKGKLANGQEIAVKRLSKKSGQGIAEFVNEVSLIAKLQHRNLVRLLGCCIERGEKILIYEYMPNGSLDTILFVEEKRSLLDWGRRFHIIMGIARGIVYLHQDSRLRIIHRDLKASNILLDEKMDPKISDFGTARIFGGDQIEGNTKRVIGTCGYMSPEYAMDGLFSEKSDVFSFGVLVLEIVSGRRNRGFFHDEDDHNLLGHVWRLWKEGNTLELMDPSIAATDKMTEMLRCIQVALLCVQERAEDRPKMSLVALMLASEDTPTPPPKGPGFGAGKSLTLTGSSSPDSCTVNEITLTTLEGR